MIQEPEGMNKSGGMCGSGEEQTMTTLTFNFNLNKM